MGTEYTKYKNLYNKDNYSRITLYFPKNEKEAIDEYCKANSVAVAEFIKGLVYDKIGDIIKKPAAQQESMKIEIFYILPCVMIFTCGNKWMISGPDERGYKFGTKIYYANPERIKEKFANRQIDEKTYNKWERIFSSDNVFKSGEDYNGDIKELTGKLNLVGECYKIYDSFPTGE